MPVPARIGKYEIVDRIGRGGMGVVYKARDSVLGRMVAVKVMTSNLSDSTEGRERFLREARAVSMLQHANIVVVHELGELEGNPYIVMEFLDGEPLDRTIREHTPMTVLQKIDIILQVTKALQYAHGRGIVHRDIKPANIMMMRDGSAKVVDFGMAHLADETITRSGVLLGTVSFMSPEQLNGEPADGRTDIFSVGIVFYLLLTGKSPFEGISTAETITKILLEQPARLEQSSSVNQPELQPILDKALAKRKEDRYQTCSEMYDALSRVRKRYETQAQLAALEEERKALMAQLGKQSGSAPVIAPQSAQAPVTKQTNTMLTPAASSAKEAPSAAAVAQSPDPQPRPQPPTPTQKAGSNRTKVIVAGLALLIVAAVLSLRLIRHGNPQTPTAATAIPAPPSVPPPAAITQPPPSPSAASSSDTGTPPPSSTSTSLPQPPVAAPSTASSEPVPRAGKLPGSSSLTPSSRESPTSAHPVTNAAPATAAPLSEPAAGLTPEEMNRRGNEALQSRDYGQALAWYRKSAEQGFAPGEAGLAFMYQHALGVPKDYAQAQQWYRRAAEQGLPRAESEVGQGYLLGQGLSMDYKQAAEWFRKSAEQGNPFGQHQLGLMYLRGWGGLPRDYAQAVEWFRKSAEQNLPVGQYSLGNMYLNGWGLPQDYSQAAQWFRKAAEQDNPRAQQQLGNMYQKGWGVPKDDAQAQYWLDKAKAATPDQQ
ncbi:MAG: serine/threonine-protein kinase [Acidobacteriota bacterium]|nr:serine/threonine-protein kinase [Acidobacteriota bacterium]